MEPGPAFLVGVRCQNRRNVWSPPQTKLIAASWRYDQLVLEPVATRGGDAPLAPIELSQALEMRLGTAELQGQETMVSLFSGGVNRKFFCLS